MKRLSIFMLLLLHQQLFCSNIDSEKISNVISYIEHLYAKPVQSDMTGPALKGILSSLDPYSTYLNPYETGILKQLTSGKFIGIGITLSLKNNQLTIESVSKNGPAQNAGLQVGDVITHINNTRTDSDLLTNIQRLRGEINTEVTITINNNPVTLIRTPIDIKETFTKDFNHIGYIRLNLFTNDTLDDLVTAVHSHSNKDALIIDLRYNPGGLLASALNSTIQFLDGDAFNEGIITHIHSKYQDIAIPIPSDSKDITGGKPLYILIGNNTASGAEIFASTLKHYQRATIIGQTSTGKGSIQSLIPLEDGSSIKLTTAYFTTPDDQPISQVGISPNFEMSIEPDLMLNQVITFIETNLRSTS